MQENGLELIQSFVVVAQELNFRRGAERLNVDQSALTRRIQKLERLLGFALLERSTRNVSLTPGGRTFYEHNSDLLQSYLNSIETARRTAEGKTGLLRIGYMAFAATELMPRAVGRFQQRHPYVDIKLCYIRTQRQKLALVNDEIDVGYMIGPFDHSDFYSLLLTSEPLFAVMPPNHPLARKRTVRPADLAETDLILGDMSEWEVYRWRISELFNAEGVPLRIKLEASNTLALVGLVAAGLGVTICPESLIGFFSRSVETRLIKHPDFRIQTILVWRRTNRTEAVRKFVDVAKKLSAQV